MKPARSERRKRATRDRILGAAGELFGQRGYAATSIDDICHQADVARQTFFNHFPSKEDLLAVLVNAGSLFVCAVVDRACEEAARRASACRCSSRASRR